MIRVSTDASKATPARPRWATRHIDHLPTLATPGCRLVLLEACGGGGESGFCVHRHPVIALESRVRQTFRRRCLGDAVPDIPAGASAAQLRAAGWSYGGSSVVHGVVAVSPDGADELVSSLDPWWLTGACKIVACDWPPDQDGERLAGIIGELQDLAAAAEVAR